MNYQRIHPIDLLKEQTSEPCIVDVRTFAEAQSESLPNCIHIPLHDLTPERFKAELAQRGQNPMRETRLSRRASSWCLLRK